MSRAELRAAFTEPAEFTTSPLYRALSSTVAADEELLDLAALGRPGQYPTFLFFGAVHQLLLAGAQHRLAGYYPSVVERAAPPDGDAGPVLVDFCREHHDELAAIIGSRLVQTNQVRRAIGLRLGLAALAGRVTGPLSLIEVGASAGLHLRQDRYGYRLGGRQFGDAGSPVQLTCELLGNAPLPDLDALPELGRVLGVDLAPVDAADPDARAWLRALVWPENHLHRELLSAALDLIAPDPPEIRQGDAVELLGDIGSELPDGQPRLVWHSATRLHVAADRRPAFDDAIASVGRTGPLWWLQLEDEPDPDPRPAPARPGGALRLIGPDGTDELVAVVDGHLGWVELIPRDPAVAVARSGT